MEKLCFPPTLNYTYKRVRLGQINHFIDFWGVYYAISGLIEKKKQELAIKTLPKNSRLNDPIDY